MSRRRGIAVGASVAVVVLAGAGLGFRRTTVQGGQVCLWWGTRQITYLVNDFSALPAIDVCGLPTAAATDADHFHSTVKASFDSWANAGANQATATPACTDLQLTAGTTPSTNTGADNQNVIVVRRASCNTLSIPSDDSCLKDGTCADKYNCWDTTESGHTDSRIIALTTASYRPSTGEIFDADMELNGWDGTSSGTSSTEGQYFTCIDPSPPGLINCVSLPAGSNCCTARGAAGCIDMDVQNTATHEAGHFLGLAHPCELNVDPMCTAHPEIDRSVTMYPSASPGETSKRTLEADDINGICAIYPAGQKTANCIDGPCLAPCVPPPSGGGCGCGSVGPEGLLGLLGLLALRGRRRRR